MRCKQCKRDLPTTSFLVIKKRGFRVTKCNGCAQANMEKWARTSLSSMRADKVQEIDE